MREHVVADDEVERALRGDVELVVIHQARRLDAVHLLQEKLLALPDRHGMDVGAEEAAQSLGDHPCPRADFEHAGVPWRHQGADQIQVDAVFEPIQEQALEVVIGSKPKVIGNVHAGRGATFQRVTIGLGQWVRIQQRVRE